MHLDLILKILQLVVLEVRQWRPQMEQPMKHMAKKMLTATAVMDRYVH